MQSIFLIGIGGMGMTPLALYLYKCGFRVYGWDDQPLPENVCEWFAGKITLSSEIPPECQTVVYSSAISATHPLRQASKKRALSTFQRGVYLAQILKDKKLIGIVGSHGKTSTTAWLIHFLKSQNFPCDYLLGGLFQSQYLPADHDKNSEWVIAEIDESDGTLLNFYPEYLIVLNDDWDHPAFYKTAEAYANALKQLCKQTKTGLFLSQALKWKESFPNLKTVYTFGPKGIFDGQLIENDLQIQGKFPNATYPANAVFSLDNVLGALAASFTLTEKLPDTDVFFTFPGIKRRQECLFKNDFLSVTTDYAHHPTELATYLRFAKNISPGHKHWVVFEPHRYSRTKTFADKFANVLSKADKSLLFPIYSASESNETNISSQEIAKGLTNVEGTEFLELSNFRKCFEKETVPVSIHFLGAGIIDKWSKNWLSRLKEEWFSILSKATKSLQRNISLRTLSTFKIGGDALFFAKPEALDELLTLLRTLHTLKLPWFVLGNGSNLLIPEKTFNGMVIQCKSSYWQQINYLSDNSFEVGCGVTLKRLMDSLEKNGIGGFEFLEGIPGTLGGALKMNAGTGKESLFDNLLTLTIVTDAGTCETLNKDKIQYSYRKCPTLDNAIAVKAIFQGKKCNEAIIKAKRDNGRKKRLENQPLGLSLGCFFKNTLDEPTGKLLDKLGLKGRRIGGAYVSEKHANFILNDGNASFQNVIQLVRFIQKQVKQRTGIILEPEVRLLGQKWEDFL